VSDKQPTLGQRVKRFMLGDYSNQSGSATQIPPSQQGLFPPANPPMPNQSQPVANPATVYPSAGQGASRAQAGGRPPVHTAAIGSTGTISFSGYPREDYLEKMMGYQKALLFDQMKRSDSAIKMCLSAVKNPIKDATYDIDPADPENKEYVQHAEFIKFLLFENMDKPFEEFISEALTCIEHGHSVFEVIDKIVIDDEAWGNFIGIKSLAFRSQKTILRWYLDGDQGGLTGIMQLAYGDLARNITIPGEFLIVFTMDKEGDNYEGVSMLRPAYGPWWRKDNYLKINAIGIEKFAIPTPFVQVPEGKENSTQYDSLVAALEIYTTHESNWLTYPEGWNLELKPSAYDPQKVEVSIDNEDKRIAKAFLGNFLELGMGGAGTGNRAMSEDLSSFFLGSVKFIANEVCAGLNKTVIKRAIDLKFGPQAKYPKLKASGIDDKAGLEFAQLMKAFADAQYITPDDILEEHLRKRVGVPKMSLKGQRAVKAVGAAGVDGAANPTYKQMSESRFNLLERMRLAEFRRSSRK
jgi:hypothetical protein